MKDNQFWEEIDKHLLNHCWIKKNRNNQIYYTKHENVTIPYHKKYNAINTIVNSLKVDFLDSMHEEIHCDSIINPYNDTDYMVACLQLISPFIKEHDLERRVRWYSFQPVIRKVPKEKIGVPGYLSCFVNVGTMIYNANLSDYLLELELWFTALSHCSIHISSISLQVKKSTNIYDGIGLTLYVGNIEIGQCNYYSIERDNKKVIVTDFGFGLERICWAANGFAYFDLIQQRPLDFCLGNRLLTEKLSMVVLLIMSGIKPNSTKYGLRVRKLIVDIVKINSSWNYDSSIKFLFKYWSMFIQSQFSFVLIKEIIEKEVVYQLNKYIGKKYDYCLSERQLRKDTDEVILWLLKNHLLEATHLYIEDNCN